MEVKNKKDPSLNNSFNEAATSETKAMLEDHANLQ